MVQAGYQRLASIGPVGQSLVHEGINPIIVAEDLENRSRRPSQADKVPEKPPSVGSRAAVYRHGFMRLGGHKRLKV